MPTVFQNSYIKSLFPKGNWQQHGSTKHSRAEADKSFHDMFGDNEFIKARLGGGS
jgi:hypothetical protein